MHACKSATCIGQEHMWPKMYTVHCIHSKRYQQSTYFEHMICGIWCCRRLWWLTRYGSFGHWWCYTRRWCLGQNCWHGTRWWCLGKWRWCTNLIIRITEALCKVVIIYITNTCTCTYWCTWQCYLLQSLKTRVCDIILCHRHWW